MSLPNFLRILVLGVSENRDLIVPDAAVEVGEQGSGFWGNDGCFEVGSRETANCFE